MRTIAWCALSSAAESSFVYLADALKRGLKDFNVA